MSEFILQWIPDNKILIAIISILINVFISISGFLPSAFLTAFNIAVFDFKMGLLLSILGEATGAIISFILYRKGLTRLTKQVNINNKWLLKLQYTKGLEAIILVLILRTLPFVPSGLVTLVASFSKMGLFAFAISSTVGKVPSMFMEAYAVDRAMRLSTEWQLFSLIILLIIIAYQILNKRKKQ
jgi:uncharacterized membrane protein YdjX (TVP38/TMEM64 family)